MNNQTKQQQQKQQKVMFQVTDMKICLKYMKRPTMKKKYFDCKNYYCDDKIK